MLIGLSLSYCCQDMAVRLVDVDHVAYIISSTAAESDEVFEGLLERYNKSYWRQFPGAAAIALRLWREGKILQPRLATGLSNPFNPALLFLPEFGHWLNAEQTHEPLDEHAPIDWQADHN